MPLITLSLLTAFLRHAPHHSQRFEEELEQADIGTPLLEGDAEGLRGRVALRRVHHGPGQETPRTPRAADADDDDTAVELVDPSDKAVTYRMPAHATPKVAPNGPTTKMSWV